MNEHDEFEPNHTSSPTDHALTELQLYGFHPREDEPDPRPIPEDRVIAGAVADIFDALIATMADTGLDADLDDLLWSTVNTFHRAVERVERTLDDNEQAQKQGQREQDGSEVKAVQLEALIATGQRLIERRDALEIFRDTGADLYRKTTGSNWSPRHGSRVNHRQLTSAMIDSRDFIAARKRADRAYPAGRRTTQHRHHERHTRRRRRSRLAAVAGRSAHLGDRPFRRRLGSEARSTLCGGGPQASAHSGPSRGLRHGHDEPRRISPHRDPPR